MTKQCPVCGKEFETNRNYQKYCSPQCKKEAKRQNNARRYKHKNPKLIICPMCKKTFLRTEGNQKYCSPECASEAHRISARECLRSKRLKKKIEACKAKYNNCFSCDMPVGVCRYD